MEEFTRVKNAYRDVIEKWLWTEEAWDIRLHPSAYYADLIGFFYEHFGIEILVCVNCVLRIFRVFRNDGS